MASSLYSAENCDDKMCCMKRIISICLTVLLFAALPGIERDTGSAYLWACDTRKLQPKGIRL